MDYSFSSQVIFLFFLIYMVFILMFIKMREKITEKIDKNSFFWQHRKQVKGILCIMAILGQVGYAMLLRRNIGFDCGTVQGTAVELLDGNLTNVIYFAMYGNNVFLLLVLEIWFRVAQMFGCTNYLVIAILFNVIIIDLALLYLSKICLQLFGEKYHGVEKFFSYPMLAITPYISVVYTDTLSLLFPIIIFYQYLCLKKEQEKIIKRVILITVFTIIGYLIKPTNVIILIAIVMVESWNFLFHKKCWKHLSAANIKKVMLYFLVIGMTTVLIYGIFTMYKNRRLNQYISKEMIEENSFPMTHFLMMGLKPVDYEGTYYGCYFEDDVLATQSYVGTQAKVNYHWQEIKKRLKAMGIKGYLSYLYDKYTWVISDGTFFYGREGNFYTSDPYEKGKIASTIQKYVYFDQSSFRNVTIHMMQAYWCFLLSMVTFSAFIGIGKKEKSERSEIHVLRLAIIGILLFILLFEARSRYLINYLPIFMILGVYGIKMIDETITRKDHLLKKKLLKEASK